jgi:hypothetical protein
LRPVCHWSCILAVFAIGCNPAPSQAPDPLAVPLENAQSPLTISTYDGSGQATEPSVVFFDSPWHGFRYWMALSPYPNGDASKENPSIVVSDDGGTWQVPAGLINPLALPGPVGYLADASIFYDRNSDQLWVYYLDTRPSTGNLGVKRLISSDGVHWQSQGTLFEVPVYSAESPTVEKTDGGYYMWVVNSGGGRVHGSQDDSRVQDFDRWDQLVRSTPGRLFAIRKRDLASQRLVYFVEAAVLGSTGCLSHRIRLRAHRSFLF